MIDNMAANGMKPSEADLIIKSWKKEYDTALKKSTQKTKEGKLRSFTLKPKIINKNCNMEHVHRAKN
jgi:hypothetical protein